jgi:hypothetical protein
MRYDIAGASALFVWLISHQPAVLFSKQTSHQQPASSTFLSEQTSTRAISQQPNEQAGTTFK